MFFWLFFVVCEICLYISSLGSLLFSFFLRVGICPFDLVSQITNYE